MILDQSLTEVGQKPAFFVVLRQLEKFDDGIVACSRRGFARKRH
jgi:hypothetical protein